VSVTASVLPTGAASSEPKAQHKQPTLLFLVGSNWGGLRIALSFCLDLLYCADIPDRCALRLT